MSESCSQMTAMCFQVLLSEEDEFNFEFSATSSETALSREQFLPPHVGQVDFLWLADMTFLPKSAVPTTCELTYFSIKI
jgi:hypothetical protein